MSTGAPSVLHRVRRPHGWIIWLVAGLVAASAIGVVVDRTVRSPPTPAAHAEQQRILERLVTGPERIAPGVTAYVAGPHGTWLGSAGVANPQTREPMRPDARMRLDSVSKWWATAVVLQLAQEGKLGLGDTVQRWLPGLLPYGDRITIHMGPALETIERLGGEWDFVFVDADKENYGNYYEALVPRLAPGGLMAIDNTLWSGRVLDGDDDTETTRSIRELNDRIASDDRVVAVQLTVRDGVTLVRRR